MMIELIELTDLDNKKIYLNKYQVIAIESWKLDTRDVKRLDQDFGTLIRGNTIATVVREDVMTVLKKIEGVR